MKFKFIIVILLSIAYTNEWINISSLTPIEPSIELNSSNINNTEIELNLKGFHLKEVNINNQEFHIATFPNGASNLELGMPNLSHIAKSVIVPNDGLMSLEIISSEFIEYSNINIAPSKGNLNRAINPETVN